MNSPDATHDRLLYITDFELSLIPILPDVPKLKTSHSQRLTPVITHLTIVANPRPGAKIMEGNNMVERFNLAKKRAVVMGGSRGIGEAIVRQLVMDGADVIFTYFEGAERAQLLASELEIAAFQCDNRDAAAIERFILSLSHIDILIVNSGAGVGGPAEVLPTHLITEMFSLNTLGPYFSTVAAMKIMRDEGRIIYIGSTAASRIPSPGLCAYAASKSALHAMAKGFCRELGHRRITVNVVEPGPTDTQMNPADGPFADEARTFLAIKRHVLPIEVAALVGFLASSRAAMITGATIPIDGGAAA